MIPLTTFALSAQQLADDGRLRDLRHVDDEILLDDMILVEDDAAAIGRPEGAEEDSWFERLSSGVRLRKQLLVEDPRAQAAWLLFCGREVTDNDAPLHVRCNGTVFERPPTKIAHPGCLHYYTEDWGSSRFDNWFVIEVPVEALQAGLNEIELWCEAAEPAWEVMVAAASETERGSEDRVGHPNRSARSADGGRSWDDAHLGWQGLIDGEYCVRFSLDRHVVSGTCLSPVIDLTGETEILRSAAVLQRARLTLEADLPVGTSARLRVRHLTEGVTTPDAAGGDDWLALIDTDAAGAQQPGSLTCEIAGPARFVQVEMELATADPRSTPRLRGLRVEAAVVGHAADAGAAEGAEVQAGAGAGADSVGVRDGQDGDRDSDGGRASHLHFLRGRTGHIDLPAHGFTWEEPEALAGIRQRHGLDEIIEGAPSEFAAQLRLMNWAYRVPIGRLNPYAWSYEDLPQLDAAGKATLLPPYETPRREGHCLYCNLTLIGALLSMGWAARWVNVSTKHTYGHEVTEVWSNEFDKWIFLDATRDYYMYDPATGVPLSLTEISDRLGAIVPEPVTWDRPVQGQLTDDDVPSRVDLAYRDPGRPVFAADQSPHDLLYMGHLQRPLRNDFSSRPTPVPWRISSNWGGDQFLCYYSDAFPRKREYARHTPRTQDFSPRLNQTQLILHDPGDGSAVVRVEVATDTPWFADYEVSVDGLAPRREAAPTWDWSLHEGVNQLQVRSRNRFGIHGPASTAEIIHTP